MLDRDPLDPRLTFYLEHRDQIDEWLKLPELERQAADVFFRSLADPLEEVASELPGSPELWRRYESPWKKLLLHMPGWKYDQPEEPIVGVAFEWNANKHGFGFAYIGLWIDMRRSELESLRGQLIDALSLEGFKRTPYWIGWKYVPPSQPRYWEDMDGFAQETIRALTGLWKDTWESIDRTFKKWSDGGAG